MKNNVQLLLGFVLSGLFLFACGENIESQNFSGTESSIKKEMREKLKLAKEGDKDAQMLLSHMYLGRMENPDYPLDQEKGVYWLEKFAADQHPIILEQVGEMFHNGTLGVEKDLNKAFAWYKQAADLGSATSMDLIGMFYSNGDGELKQSCEQAVKWYEKSAQAGNSYANNNIAWEYATCPFDNFRDGEKALKLALEVVANDDYESSIHLDTLAAAYAEADDFDKAVITQRKALGMINKEKSEERFDDYLKRLKVYKSGNKWREPLKSERLLLDKGTE